MSNAGTQMAREGRAGAGCTAGRVQWRRHSHSGEEQQRADAQQPRGHVVREIVVVEQEAGGQVQHHRVGHDDGRHPLLAAPRARLVLLDGRHLVLNLLQHLDGGRLPLSAQTPGQLTCSAPPNLTM